MARNSCLDCVRKHIASASISMDEAANGYPFHRWYAVGDLDHAASECRKEHPRFSRIIRKAWLDIINGGDPDFDRLILMACYLDDPAGTDLQLPVHNTKSFDFSFIDELEGDA